MRNHSALVATALRKLPWHCRMGLVVQSKQLSVIINQQSAISLCNIACSFLLCQCDNTPGLASTFHPAKVIAHSAAQQLCYWRGRSDECFIRQKWLRVWLRSNYGTGTGCVKSGKSDCAFGCAVTLRPTAVMFHPAKLIACSAAQQLREDRRQLRSN